MRRSLLFGLAFLNAGVCTLRATDTNSVQPSATIRQALQDESAGLPVDRGSHVSSTSNISNVDAWNAGWIKLDGTWVKSSDLSQSKLNPEYIKLRDSLVDTPEGHLKLARWCRSHHPDIARAHYFAWLDKHPNNVEARAYLKHVLVDDRWVDSTEFKGLQSSLNQNLQKLDEWSQKIKGIVAGLKSGQETKITKALADLENIKDNEAVLALELWALNIDDDLAQPLVRQIATNKSKDACLALMRVAVASPRDSIRTLATSELRRYPVDFYVPELLSQLEGESDVQNQLVSYPNGYVAMNTVISNELHNRKNQQLIQKQAQVLSVFSSSHQVGATSYDKAEFLFWGGREHVPKEKAKGHVGVTNLSSASERASAQGVYVPPELQLSVTESMAEEGRIAEQIAQRKNRMTAERMVPIFRVLRETTGATLEDKPQAWWAWWREYGDQYPTQKPINRSYRIDQHPFVVAGQYASRNHRSEMLKDLGKTYVYIDCFVAGTLIQTETGLVPVEKLQIGDRVLSQDVETAELTLKPVALTTIRPPKSTIKIVLDSDVIESTGGHSWWVSGKGWVKTRDLEAGMHLHTSTGNVPIREVVRLSEEKTTYNLVVDGFHTYFVGENRVLSHDNSSISPTLRTVPGFGTLADVK